MSSRTTTRWVLFGLSLVLGCDHAVSLRLTPQTTGLLDGLDGSLRVYAVPADFACPGSVLSTGTASPRWPDACTDSNVEPFARTPAQPQVGTATLTREIAIAGSTPVTPVGELAPGRYAFFYVGVRDGCDVEALGCSVVSFPGDVRIDVAPPVGPACLSGCETLRATADCISCALPP